MQKVSVLIITAGRSEHVREVLRGLEHGADAPDEVIVVHMNEPADDYRTYTLPLSASVFRDDTVALPLAAARNFAAEQAASDLLIFLDADCVPGKNLVGNYRRASESGVITLGDVFYLNEADSLHVDHTHLPENARPHPDRRLKDLADIPHELFWSLNFSCTKETFQRIGGFDPGFKGYGAEDTDFAFAARAKNIPLRYADAPVYHQYHPTYHPPVQHLEAIVSNAGRFFEKWGIWPMRGWLREFEALGLIRMQDDKISVVRLPEKKEVESAFNADRSGY